jgi:hypothetical protein
MQIPFSSSWKKIAISLSGGADSALLAYLLCQQITSQELHIISHIRCWKTKPWQQQNSLDVYNWLKNRFPNIIFYRHTNFIPPEMEWGDKGPTMIDEYGKQVSGDNIELRAFAEYLCVSNNIDSYYNAVTRNPIGTEFHGMPTRDIEPTENNKHLVEMNHMGVAAIHPFRFTQKNYIIKEYYRLGIVDLLDITRSCEGTFSNITYKNYKPGQYVPLCNNCFWCKEREWAINESK